jgi:hypothetical protein
MYVVGSIILKDKLGNPVSIIDRYKKNLLNFKHLPSNPDPWFRAAEYVESSHEAGLTAGDL